MFKMVDSNNWNLRQELLSQGLSSLLEGLDKKNCTYCPLCEVVTRDRKGFKAHVAGRKHNFQLTKIEKIGLEKWAKKEEKKVHKKEAKGSLPVKFVKEKKIKDIWNLNRPNRVLKDVPVQETVESCAEKEGKSDKKDVKDEAHDKESGSSNYSLLLKAFQSAVPVDSDRPSKKVANIPRSDRNQLKDSSALPSSSEMHPNMDYSGPRFNVGPPFHQFHHTHPNGFYDPMMGSRHSQWENYYPPSVYRNNNGRFKRMFRNPPRYIPPPSMRVSYPHFRHYAEEVNTSDRTSSNLWKSKHTSSPKGSQKRGSMKNASEPKLQPNSCNRDNAVNPHAGSRNAGDRYSTTDVSKSEMVQNELNGGPSSSSVGSDDKRHVATQNKISKGQESKTQLRISFKTFNSSSRNVKAPVGRASDFRRSRQRSKSDQSGYPCPRKKESIILGKSTSGLPSGDVHKARLAPAMPSDTASMNPSFSNAAIQRMNARLQSFAKYGKMPTTSQIRLLAVSGSSTQGKIDGKLQEWSKKMKESQNLTAQDRELINRLVNYYPCSRLEQKKLECCIQEHARSRKKLTLPRFNLQLSGAEISKDPPTVDDTINTMVTEVVDSLPEDLLNSLISALNSDVDENVNYDFSFGVGGQLLVPDEDGRDMSSISVPDDGASLETAISAVDELGNNSFNEKGASKGHCDDSAHSSLYLSAGNTENTSTPEDKVKVASKATVNPVDHAHLFEDKKPPIALGSSLGLSSREISIIVQNNALKIKQEPLEKDEGGASKQSSCSIDLNNCKESQSIGAVNSLVKISGVCPSLESISTEIEHGETSNTLTTSASKDSLAEGASFPGILATPLLSTPYLMESGVKLEKLAGTPQDEDISAAARNFYPGLKYIRKTVKTAKTEVGTIENKRNAVFASPSHPQKVKLSKQQSSTPACAINNQDDPAPSGGHAVIKLGPAGNTESKESEENHTFQISSVTGNSSYENDDWPIVIKKEPCSPEPEIIDIKESSNEDDEFEPSESYLQKNVPDVSPYEENIAAAFPGVIQKGRRLSQKEDSEKCAEVSSSTGAVLLEETRASAFLESGQSGPPLGSGANVPKSFIEELVEIDAVEEKLIEKTKEADQKIAHLTASLEEWKQKKYQIEQEHMKLRMKRQALLLTAAKGPAACDKYSTSAPSGSGSKTSVLSGIPSSVGSSQDTQSSSSESDEETSGSEFNISPNQKNKGKCGRKRKRARKRIHHCGHKHSENSKLRPRHRARVLKSNENSESSTGFSTSSWKCRKNSRSHANADNRNSSDRYPKKKRIANMKELQVVLQPLQLKNSKGKRKIVVSEDGDISIIKEDSCSGVEIVTENAEKEIATVIPKVEPDQLMEVCQPTESVPEAAELDNVAIDVLNAHSTAVVDLKVHGGYLYTASLDFTAKRFSLLDPENDTTTYEGHQKAVTSICLSPATNELYTTCHDGHLRCFDVETGNNNCSIDLKMAILCSCEAAGTMYLGLSGGLVIFFSFKLKKQMYELRCGQSSIGKVATVTQGALRLLCIASNDGVVSLYDTSTGLLLRCLEGRVQPPCCIQISDNLAYITTSEKSVVLFDLLSGVLQRMMNLPASSTGLEMIDNFILTSSYDGLIRCHDKDQDMAFHSIYYGAGKSMVMCMVSHRKWVFTGNRRGIVEAFKFDPTRQFPCEYGRCRQNFGRACDKFHHVNIDHLPCVISKTKTCPWRLCTYNFTPRTTVEEKKEHVKGHILQ